MNAIKKIAFSTVAIATIAQQSAFAAGGINVGVDKVQTGLQGRSDDLPTAVQGIITFITTFLYLIAVALALYGGFLMLTAAGDEEKVKKGKTVLMQAGIGLLVIFLASTIVRFILQAVQA
jgi:Type IV secretion system pilin